MKQVFIIEGSVDRADGDLLLLQVAIILGQHRLNPESLVWTMLGQTSEIRLWLVVDGEKPALNVFAEECRSLPGVRYLTRDSDENRSRVLDRIRELESRPPFGTAPASAFSATPPATDDPPRVFLPPDADFMD